MNTPTFQYDYALDDLGNRTDTGRWLQEDPIVGIPTDPMSFTTGISTATPIPSTRMIRRG